MRTTIPSLAFALSASITLTSAHFFKRDNTNDTNTYDDYDPVANYLSSMCYPLATNENRTFNFNNTSEYYASFAFSPFPCEQRMYLEQICQANGTTVIDFLAEQECLCKGDWFTALQGCDACYFAHGYTEESQQNVTKYDHSLSVAECAPTPPFQPFSNLYSTTTDTFTGTESYPSVTMWSMGVDKAPNNTAASVYYTGPKIATPGAITGSATGRLTSFTNTDYNVYTPTSIPPNSGTGTVQSASTTGSGASTSKSTGAAATRGVGMAGGILAAGLGVMVML